MREIADGTVEPKAKADGDEPGDEGVDDSQDAFSL